MALDGIVLANIAEEIRNTLPIRINRITEAGSNELIFNVHANNMRCNLIVSCHALFNRISLSNKNYSSFDNPGGFTMLLRKYLINGIIYQIDQNQYDRYLLLHIKAKDELYDERHFMLSVELMGKYANIILVDEDTGKIMDALKRIPPFENTKRTVLAGARFEAIEPQNKINPFSVDELNLNDSLVAQYAGFSKLLEEEIRYRLNRGENYSDIKSLMKSSHHLYVSELAQKNEFHILPLTHLEQSCKCYPLFEGFDELYFSAEEKERIKDLSNDLYKYIKRQQKHYAVKEGKLKESLAESLNAEKEKTYGELLFTYGHLQEKGLKEISLTDYEGHNTVIPLNSKLSVKENANKYFQLYQKKRKGKEFIEEQIAIAQSEASYFASLQEQLSFANFQDANDIKEELIRYGYLRENKKASSKKKKTNKIHLYQLHFHDNVITFGKNNLQNDYLTFKYAKPGNLWFHAKDYHGAHLIVDNPNPDEETIRLCACLAAYFSQGRMSSSVPVDYCPIKEVKKIKGAKAGFVSLNHHKTIYIDPELDSSLKIVSI